MPDADLVYPFPVPPKPGEAIEVARGILWARVSLPFRLDHVNIYLIEDHDGWAVVDTGLADDMTRKAWLDLLSGPLAGRKLTKLIVTHYHPDHIGLAGWLCRTFDLPLLTSQTCYLGCLNISLNPNAMQSANHQEFYRRHGMPVETAALVTTQGHSYLEMVEELPPTFYRLVAGDRLTLGDRHFEVLTADGHAPEQVMLFSAEDNLLLAADQVLAKITPNVSVWAVEPDGDPLGLYLRSLDRLRTTIPGDVLVLPGHQLPFSGLHQRCRELMEHHDERCRMIADACRLSSRSVADLVPIVFPKVLDPHQLGFAFAEVHAHVNYMRRHGDLVWEDPDAVLVRARTTRNT